MTGKVWFITGASSGFGRLMTEIVLKNGDSAVATLRKPEVLADLASQHSADKLLVLKLDVTHPQEIKDAFSEAIKKFGRVDTVFNNAGRSMIGEIESASEDAARAIFDTNLWGAVNVSKEAVRIFRDVNKPAGGTLLQISSLAGIQAYPAIGYYSASKYALEGISTALAAEVDPEWNIKVVLVEPGNFATVVLDSSVRTPPHPAYTKPTMAPAMVREFIKGGSLATETDTAKAVAAMYQIAQIPDPPLHFVVGKDAIPVARVKAAKLLADTDRFASWSDVLSEVESAV
ncbi:uncharacterized protein B0H18DRAFT_1134764 [Fomitopsis serialis]|uniref:uncharacterized protein n=1 Tax=Fomitopsis serialis TaxID=139415 RepID=UPI00200859C0|nr:uncharacterized protein B0H18DRAFT_1134764 [Neoantrodia serialis]KAH9938703.1 hypothetical protein B0H18DRAFT_1134764 [Neoantrodia serialis]